MGIFHLEPINGLPWFCAWYSLVAFRLLIRLHSMCSWHFKWFSILQLSHNNATVFKQLFSWLDCTKRTTIGKQDLQCPIQTYAMCYINFFRLSFKKSSSFFHCEVSMQQGSFLRNLTNGVLVKIFLYRVSDFSEVKIKSIYAVILGVFLLCTNYLCIVKID